MPAPAHTVTDAVRQYEERQGAALGVYRATVEGPDGYHMQISGTPGNVAAALRSAAEDLAPTRPGWRGGVTRGAVARAGERLASIGGSEAAGQMRDTGRVVLITPDGEFLYPDNDEDEALMVESHSAVRVKGLICRSMICCCDPGTGHKSHPRPNDRLRH